MDIEDSLTGLAKTHGVVDVQDCVVQPDVVDFQHQLDDVVDQSLGCHLPIARVQIWKTLCAEDGDPVLLRSVEHPVAELGVGGSLDADAAVETVMTLLQEHNPIIMMATKLVDTVELSIG